MDDVIRFRLWDVNEDGTLQEDEFVKLIIASASGTNNMSPVTLKKMAKVRRKGRRDEEEVRRRRDMRCEMDERKRQVGGEKEAKGSNFYSLFGYPVCIGHLRSLSICLHWRSVQGGVCEIVRAVPRAPPCIECVDFSLSPFCLTFFTCDSGHPRLLFLFLFYSAVFSYDRYEYDISFPILLHVYWKHT